MCGLRKGPLQAPNSQSQTAPSGDSGPLKGFFDTLSTIHSINKQKTDGSRDPCWLTLSSSAFTTTAQGYGTTIDSAAAPALEALHEELAQEQPAQSRLPSTAASTAAHPASLSHFAFQSLISKRNACIVCQVRTKESGTLLILRPDEPAPLNQAECGAAGKGRALTLKPRPSCTLQAVTRRASEQLLVLKIYDTGKLVW